MIQVCFTSFRSYSQTSMGRYLGRYTIMVLLRSFSTNVIIHDFQESMVPKQLFQFLKLLFFEQFLLSSRGSEKMKFGGYKIEHIWCSMERIYCSTARKGTKLEHAKVENFVLKSTCTAFIQSSIVFRLNIYSSFYGSRWIKIRGCNFRFLHLDYFFYIKMGHMTSSW